MTIADDSYRFLVKQELTANSIFDIISGLAGAFLLYTFCMSIFTLVIQGTHIIQGHWKEEEKS